MIITASRLGSWGRSAYSIGREVLVLQSMLTLDHEIKLHEYRDCRSSPLVGQSLPLVYSQVAVSIGTGLS